MFNSIYWILVAQFYLFLLGCMDIWRWVLLIQVNAYTCAYRAVMRKITGNRYVNEMMIMEQFGKN